MQAKRVYFPAIFQKEWETFEIPEPDPHTVIARTRHSLVSAGTELAIYTGSHIGYTMPNPPFPLMPHRPGYALIGDIVARGEAVSDLAIGQRVFMQVGHGTMGVADVREQTVFPLPDELSDVGAALMRIAYIALSATRAAPLQLGEAVVIYGLGLVGQFAAQLFKLNGAHPIIGVDRLDSRLAVAAANGIIPIHAEHEDVQAAILAHTQGRGADVVVEATGSPAVLSLALEAAGNGGRVVLLGSTRGKVEIDPYSHIHKKGVHVIGAHETTQLLDTARTERWSTVNTLQLLSDLLVANKLRTDGLISHTITPDQLLPIYDQLHADPQSYLGVLVDWDS